MIRIIVAAAGLVSIVLSAQPKFPQHSTGMPHVPGPPVALPSPPESHAGNLGRSISGRPIQLQRQPGRPVYPVPIYVGGGGWYPQQQWQQPAPVVLVHQQTILPPAPAPILIVNPNYEPEVAKPVLREYSQISNPYANFEPSAPKVFLLALKDGTLRQTVAFWSEGDKLHFVQPDHKQDSVTLANLDRESTKRFNAERGIEIKLPE